MTPKGIAEAESGLGEEVTSLGTANAKRLIKKLGPKWLPRILTKKHNCPQGKGDQTEVGIDRPIGSSVGKTFDLRTKSASTPGTNVSMFVSS